MVPSSVPAAHRAPDLPTRPYVLRREWPATALDLAQCPRRLSGALVFNCLGLQEGRLNYKTPTSLNV